MQLSVHQAISLRVHRNAGLAPAKKSKFQPSDLKALEKSEWSPEFERLMRNRLLMGALRYGTFAEKAKKKEKWDLLGAVSSKLEKYEETGNTEYLVDAANYLMLAFEFDDHSRKHFHALDDHHGHCKTKLPTTEKRH